jgi:hypothetical protein
VAAPEALNKHVHKDANQRSDEKCKDYRLLENCAAPAASLKINKVSCIRGLTVLFQKLRAAGGFAKESAAQLCKVENLLRTFAAMEKGSG